MIIFGKQKISRSQVDVIEGEELVKEEHELLHHTGNPKKWRSIVRDHKYFRWIMLYLLRIMHLTAKRHLLEFLT